MIPFARSPQGAAGVQRTANVAASTLPLDGLRLSVVIPTSRRPDLLCRCLAAVLSQTLDRAAYEVIVVDDGQSSDTQAVVDAFRLRPDAPVVRLVRPRHGWGPAIARNAGWRAAYGKVIAFTGDDMVPASDWLANGERALVPGLVALCGAVSRPRVDSRVERRTGNEPERMRRSGFASTNAFVRRSALLTTGGFDERFHCEWREDSDLQFRLLRDAGPVGRSPETVVEHPAVRPSWGACLTQQKSAFFDALLYKKHPRLYREQIRRSPPWVHYAIVALVLAAIVLWFVGIGGSAVTSLALALAGIGRVAAQRLGRVARTPERVVETLFTSALIPFLCVYWRLRGALHFRVLFL